MDANTRKTAHTLLDFYAGFAASDSEEEQENAFKTSMQRLNEGDAILASTDDEGNLTLDFGPVLLASGVTYQWFIGRLASASGKTEEELTFELREFIDSLGDE